LNTKVSELINILINDDLLCYEKNYIYNLIYIDLSVIDTNLKSLGCFQLYLIMFDTVYKIKNVINWNFSKI